MTTTATALTLNTREAAHAFATLATITPAKTAKPVLQQVKVTPDAQWVSLSATSLDVSVEMFLTGAGSEGAPFLVPAKEMAQLLKQIDTEDVELVVDGTRVEVRSGQGVFTLLADDVDQFPSVLLGDSAESCSLAGDAMDRGLRTALESVIDEETRYAINGVCVELVGDEMFLVGTDGRRLSVVSLEVNGLRDGCGIIPVGAAKRVAQLAAHSDSIGLTISDSSVTVVGAGFKLQAQLRDGAYPPWRGVIPKAEAPSVSVPRDELLSVVRRVSTICDGQHLVTMRFEGDEMALLTSSPSRGSASEVLSLDTVVDEPFEFCVNSKFLLDGLKHATSEMVPLRAGADSTVPSLWKCGPGYEFVLMGVSAT